MQNSHLPGLSEASAIELEPEIDEPIDELEGELFEEGVEYDDENLFVRDLATHSAEPGSSCSTSSSSTATCSTWPAMPRHQRRSCVVMEEESDSDEE